MNDRYYTTSTAFLEALAEAGIRYLFANLGSDHPGIIEALAQAQSEVPVRNLPELVVCPHETVALSAAHAYAAVTRTPQAVLVHVDSGTQNLGGAVNNASRGRVPVLIFAGAAPYTIEGELPGSRNEFIHWIQDVHDQRGILRNYVKYDNELRTGRNVKQLVQRSLQIACSEPAGPVYLVGPREVMEEELSPQTADPASYTPVAPAALAEDVVAEVAGALAGARHPLIITSYLGREPAAVAALIGLADLLAIPVLESVPNHVNFPASHPLHCGYQWNTSRQNPLLAQADVILSVDSDVPWIHTTTGPRPVPPSTASTPTRSNPGCRCGTSRPAGSPPPTPGSRCTSSRNSWPPRTWSTRRRWSPAGPRSPRSTIGSAPAGKPGRRHPGT